MAGLPITHHTARLTTPHAAASPSRAAAPAAAYCLGLGKASCVGRMSVEEPQPVSGGGGLAPAGHAELGEDAGDVHADGLGADEQALADLLVGPPVSQVAQHLDLPAGQTQALEVAALLGRAGLAGEPQAGVAG